MLSLYIHIPFCVSKCHYCDFNSIGIGRARPPEAEYVEALRREFARWALSLSSEARQGIGTVFFGGGTPSLFQPESIAAILTEAERLAPIQDGAECTLELNPKTATRDKMTGFRAAGCNRLSIGVQSLDEGLLAQLARAHTSEDALHALDWAFAAEFPSLSIDLMYGLPEQDPSQLAVTLERLEDYPLRHLSAYELIVEEGTPFFDRHREGRLPLPQDQTVLEMRRAITAFAANKGMGAYEISNYAAAGQESRHNLHYWDYDSFVGLGAGAVSFLNKRECHSGLLEMLGVEAGADLYGLRLTNARGLQDYQAQAHAWAGVSVEPITLSAAMGEFMMMGLRKRRGIRYRDFEEKLGVAFPENFRESIAAAVHRGWMEQDPAGCRLSEPGILWSNEVLQEFL